MRNSVLDMELRLRDDHSRPSLPTEDVLKNAADTKDDQFQVPPILGGQE
jgi:Asp-tRNA(Asn)/Glu-tRNA(Gln) amidotransferase C subunit